MEKPFFVKEGQHPVLNTARISETVIGGLLISIMTGSMMFFVMSKTADGVFSTKLDQIANNVAEMKAEMVEHYKSDEKFKIEITKEIVENNIEIKNLREKDAHNHNR